jgi:hypothetical protein
MWLIHDRTKYGPLPPGTPFEITNTAEIERLLRYGYRIIPGPPEQIAEPQTPPLGEEAEKSSAQASLGDGAPIAPELQPEFQPERLHNPRLDELSGGRAGKTTARSPHGGRRHGK